MLIGTNIYLSALDEGHATGYCFGGLEVCPVVKAGCLAAGTVGLSESATTGAQIGEESARGTLNHQSAFCVNSRGTAVCARGLIVSFR